MSKLLTLVQLIMASGPLTISNPWPRRLLRRLSVALSLLMVGSILTGVLITVGLYWGYQKAIEYGYSPDHVMVTLVGVIVALLIATGIGFAIAVRGIKSQFRPLSVFQPSNLTGQLAGHVTGTVQSAVRGFAEGFMEGSKPAATTKDKKSSYKKTANSR
jgi:hypothetical protein